MNRGIAAIVAFLLWSTVGFGQGVPVPAYLVVSGVNACPAASAVGTDSYACNLPVSAGVYQPQACYVFKTDVANTGAATIDFNAIGAVAIKKNVSQDLEGDGTDENSDLRAGQEVTVCFDGTNMQLQSGAGGTSSGTPPYIQSFAAPANPWTVSGATHGLGANIEVFAQKDGTTTWDRVSPLSVAIDKSSGDVTVAWAGNVAGRLMISKLIGGGAGGSGSVTDHALLTNLDFPNSGHTNGNGFENTNHHAKHQHGGSDEVATATAAANAIPKADGTGKLDAGWIPLSIARVTDINDHSDATTAIHGVSGVVVGTTDSQTLTNKRITNPLITGNVVADISPGGSLYSAANDTLARLTDSATAGSVSAGGGSFETWAIKRSTGWAAIGDGGTGSGTGPSLGGTDGGIAYKVNSSTLNTVPGMSFSGSTVAYTGLWDMSGGSSKPPSGSSLPATPCAEGTQFRLTTAAVNFQLHLCIAGVWRQQGVSTGAGVVFSDDKKEWTATESGVAKLGAGLQTGASGAPTPVVFAGNDSGLSFPTGSQTCVDLRSKTSAAWDGVTAPTLYLTWLVSGSNNGSSPTITAEIAHMTEGSNWTTPSYASVTCTAQNALATNLKQTMTCSGLSTTGASQGRSYKLRVCRAASDALNSAMIVLESAMRWTDTAACTAP